MNPTNSQRPVLLIDDNHEDLFFTKRLLTRAGIIHPVVTIDDGEEALVFLRAATLDGAAELRPCCIFCDVKMPKVNGFAVLKWMREQEALAKVSFALLTGGNLPEDRAKALALGANNFLVKYPSPDVFKRIVGEACGL